MRRAELPSHYSGDSVGLERLSGKVNGPIREPARVSDHDAANALSRPSLNRSYLPTIINSNGNGYEDHAVARQTAQWAEESRGQSDYRDKVRRRGEGPMTGGGQSDNEQDVAGTDGASAGLGVVRNQSPRRLIVLVLNRKLTLFQSCYVIYLQA